MRANLPKKEHFLNTKVPFRPDLELIEHIGSGNDAHVFRGRDHRLQIDFACKITPRANLIGAEDGTNAWRAEIEKANSLPGGIVVHFVDMGEWKEPTEEIDCVVLIADFIAFFLKVSIQHFNFFFCLFIEVEKRISRCTIFTIFFS